jgi:hypothetical protein
VAVRPLASVLERSDRQGWPVWPSGVADLTDSFCIVLDLTVIGLGQTASTSNGRISILKVIIAIMMVWPQIELRSVHQMRINFPTTSFLSMGYKYPSISCKINLLVIWISYLTFESPPPSHTSLSWSIIGVWDSSTWFEWFKLYDTNDSSSKHHRLVTLGGFHLLDGLEEWKSWVLQKDYECGPMFLWEVLCSPRLSVKSNSNGIGVWRGSSYVLQVLFVEEVYTW